MAAIEQMGQNSPLQRPPDGSSHIRHAQWKSQSGGEHQ
jgi:hypothetical protein